MNKNVIRFVSAIPLFLCAIACSSSLAMAADAPSVDTLKQVLDQQLQKLRPVGYTERNVLFQEVRAGTPPGFWFQVTATIRDYGPGYPANQYYGETCVGQVDKWPFELTRDPFGGWRAEGRMSTLMSDGTRQCKPNPSAGVSSIPLSSLKGSPAPSGPAAAAPPPAPVAGKDAGLPAGKAGAQGSVAARSYHCVFSIDSVLQTVPGFTIKAGGGYMDADGKNGTYTFDPAQSLIAFHGGSMDGNAAHYDGRIIHIYNEKRTRTVIDCD
jgi:hypothetical protein